jgi:hypothetical protein
MNYIVFHLFFKKSLENSIFNVRFEFEKLENPCFIIDKFCDIIIIEAIDFSFFKFYLNSIWSKFYIVN